MPGQCAHCGFETAVPCGSPMAAVRCDNAEARRATLVNRLGVMHGATALYHPTIYGDAKDAIEALSAETQVMRDALQAIFKWRPDARDITREERAAWEMVYFALNPKKEKADGR